MCLLCVAQRRATSDAAAVAATGLGKILPFFVGAKYSGKHKRKNVEFQKTCASHKKEMFFLVVVHFQNYVVCEIRIWGSLVSTISSYSP